MEKGSFTLLLFCRLYFLSLTVPSLGYAEEVRQRDVWCVVLCCPNNLSRMIFRKFLNFLGHFFKWPLNIFLNGVISRTDT